MKRVGWTLVCLWLVLGAACDSGLEFPTEPPGAGVLNRIGDPEGELRLVAWAGYAEDGSSDPDVDWVKPFTERTGCRVVVRYADSAEEMVGLMRREGPEAYDGVSASGEVAGELIAAGEVSAVDPALFPAYEDVLEPLRSDNARHYVAADGQVFGMPALYGPNLLLFDTRRVRPRPTSWDVVFEADSPYGGRIAMIDSPMAIADAALYLAVHRPDLGIEDPFALTPAQLDAATLLLEEQAVNVSLYWSLFTDQVDAFSAGDVVVGAGWPITLELLDLERDLVDAVQPIEGMTGWADTWMVAADAPHPNCMLEWMKWMLRPDVQAQVAHWYGASPSNGRACAILRRELGDLDLVDGPGIGTCGDERFLAALELWRMPTVECGDDRGRVCAGYPAWRLRWRTVRE